MTPERIEHLATTGEEIRGDEVRALAGIAMAACEEMAELNRCECVSESYECVVCGGLLGPRRDCLDCDGTGDAYETWQDACRGLGVG